MNPDPHQLIRIALAGTNDIEEWRLGDAALAKAKGYPRRYKADVIDDYGIVFIDVALEHGTGELVCHEVNGPNAVGSDALTGDSQSRAENEAKQTMRRLGEMGFLRGDGKLSRQVVTVHAHQHWKFFRTGGEFYPRVDRFASTLEGLLPGNVVARRGAGEELGDEAVAVVMGDVPSVAANLTVNQGTRGFEYRGRPAVFLGNPNLIPELVRVGKLQRDGRRVVGADLGVFHAWRFAMLVHDKAAQQRLLSGTGIRPLRHFEANTREDAKRLATQMIAHGAVVVKPNGASGGTGVHAIVPGMSEAEIGARIDAVFADCLTKYGANADAAALPIRGFEFVRSTGYAMSDGDHLWDLRFAVQFEPGVAEVYPVSMRLTPHAFDAAKFHLERDQWISNVSGRRTTLLKSGMDDAALAAVGLTPAKMQQAMDACVKWTAKAWDCAVRDGGRDGAVYEDECESEDAMFYPWSKFSA